MLRIIAEIALGLAAWVALLWYLAYRERKPGVDRPNYTYALHEPDLEYGEWRCRCTRTADTNTSFGHGCGQAAWTAKRRAKRAADRAVTMRNGRLRGDLSCAARCYPVAGMECADADTLCDRDVEEQREDLSA